ncbi:MAG: glycoside hydrolase family 3 N-terminal domain-containing protein [Nostocaceae cyanobacterium]|nr:glycoside hydrolase family 3 N-terminal domain-containing protein [Nostocaceae cyanobacterium]
MLPDINSLSLAQQVAQMVVVRACGFLFDHQIQYPDWEPPAAKLQHWVENLGVGGVILLGASAGELAIRNQQLQNWANIPLLIAADIEEGVGQRFSGATWFPPPMALSAILRRNQKLGLEYAQKMGALTAKEALAIGINWVLAPVVDVNNNPDNPVINIRAFGETTDEVSQLACAFIRGAKNYPILTTAKHFPGHGDTAVDSHLELPTIPHSPTRLAEVELPPFEAAIASGVDGVMSAHLMIPCWDSQFPATLSANILQAQLREKLQFPGLIVTDALVMGAIANGYGANEAPVMAVEAGADILLMPVDPEGAISALCKAVETGRISHSRIIESVERIWQAKGKISGCSHPADNLTSQVAQSDARNTAGEILKLSQITYGSLPLPSAKLINATEVNNSQSTQLRNLIVVDDLLTSDFFSHRTPSIDLPEQMGYETQIYDRHSSKIANFAGNYPTLLQMFIRGNPFRGSARLNQAAEDLFKKLLTDGSLQGLLVYGSPYVWHNFIPLLPPNIPAVFSYGQMPAAQETALRTLFAM